MLHIFTTTTWVVLTDCYTYNKTFKKASCKLTKILYILKGNNRVPPPDSKSSHKTCYCYHLLHCEGRRMSALQNTLCSTLLLRQCVTCWTMLYFISMETAHLVFPCHILPTSKMFLLCSPIANYMQMSVCEHFAF